MDKNSLVLTQLLLTNVRCYVTSHDYLKTRPEVALEWLDVKSNLLWKEWLSVFLCWQTLGFRFGI